MPEISREEIRRELEAVLGELMRSGAISPLPGPLAKDHSNWSAHGQWSSGARALEGTFSLSSSLSQPREAAGVAERLDRLLGDVSSARFMEVAKSLKALVTEK